MTKGDVVGKRWFAVRTQPNREQRAKHQLDRQQFRTFLPLIEKSVCHARKIRQVRSALFPGYLFVELDLSKDQWRCINSTYGVSCLVMAGERPAFIPAGVIELIIELSKSNGLVDFTPDLQPGMSVQMVSGPLSGLIGRLNRCDARGRVEVLLEVMGQEIRVTSSAKVLMPA
ncbi:transcription termination/antitermination protein NusG [Anderseniella sp. Alg231-50]|uniref:transcription termination/antitermination protein NusG n=1 Tax=Anderseniella sp. Alg231-50 TaxID=1922226 RepID=UPI00307B1EF8